jgi:hypothetical protein
MLIPDRKNFPDPIWFIQAYMLESSHASLDLNSNGRHNNLPYTVVHDWDLYRKMSE